MASFREALNRFKTSGRTWDRIHSEFWAMQLQGRKAPSLAELDAFFGRP